MTIGGGGGGGNRINPDHQSYEDAWCNMLLGQFRGDGRTVRTLVFGVIKCDALQEVTNNSPSFMMFIKCI